MNDHDRYFFEVDQEQAMLEDVNAELRMLAVETIEAEIALAYEDMIRSWLFSWYNESSYA